MKLSDHRLEKNNAVTATRVRVYSHRYRKLPSHLT